MDPAAVALTPKPPRAESLAPRVAWARRRCPRGRPCGAVSGALRARRTARRHALPGLVMGRVPCGLASARGPRGSYLSLHVKACPCM